MEGYVVLHSKRKGFVIIHHTKGSFMYIQQEMHWHDTLEERRTRTGREVLGKTLRGGEYYVGGHDECEMKLYEGVAVVYVDGGRQEIGLLNACAFLWVGVRQQQSSKPSCLTRNTENVTKREVHHITVTTFPSLQFWNWLNVMWALFQNLHRSDLGGRPTAFVAFGPEMIQTFLILRQWMTLLHSKGIHDQSCKWARNTSLGVKIHVYLLNRLQKPMPSGLVSRTLRVQRCSLKIVCQTAGDWIWVLLDPASDCTTCVDNSSGYRQD